VVGHSSGANIALQLALDATGSVRSLTLMEPAVMDVPGAREFAESYIDPVMRHYSAGAKAQAVDAFMRAVAGPRYRAVMERALPPSYFTRVVADAGDGAARPEAVVLPVGRRRACTHPGLGRARGRERCSVAGLPGEVRAAALPVASCRAVCVAGDHTPASRTEPGGHARWVSQVLRAALNARPSRIGISLPSISWRTPTFRALDCRQLRLAVELWKMPDGAHWVPKNLYSRKLGE
jgi:pimeloyl-ACP methyl ester carboxylesterase